MMRFIALLVFGVIIFSGCSTTLLVHSAWDKDQIAVDGKEGDWQYRTFYLSDQNLNLGIRNNDENLFIFVKFIDQRQRRRVLAAGFTIWFDPSGGKEKVIGIRIPGRMRGTEEHTFDGEENSITFSPVSEIEILHGEKGAPVQIPVVSLKQIQFAVSRTSDELMYEIKIPLAGVSEGGFVITPTSKDIGVEFIAGKFEMAKRDKAEGEFSRPNDGGGKEPSGAMGQGKRNGGSGGRRGGSGSSGEPKGEGKAESFDVWLKVNLAEKAK